MTAFYEEPGVARMVLVMDTSRWRKCQRERLEAGLCLQCGRRPPSEGHRMCRRCLAVKRERRQRLYNDRLSHGLCPVCGGKRGFDDIIYCHRCRQRQDEAVKRSFNRERYNAVRRRVRRRFKKSGLCTECGRDRDDSKHLTCSRCRASSRATYRGKTDPAHRIDAVSLPLEMR